MLSVLFRADRLINVPIVKHHSLSLLTCGIKNHMGLIGGSRGRLHQEIHTSIVDLASAFRPTLTVVDATRVMLRNGPTGGRLEDVATMNMVAAGTDPVACDAWAARQLGLDPRDVAHVVQAEGRGLGSVAAGAGASWRWSRMPDTAAEPPAARSYVPRLFRRVYQGYFLLFFFAALALMTDEGIRRFPTRLLLQLDPLSAVAVLGSSWLLPTGLAVALVIVALTLVFGRAFCGWICPVGTLHQLASWLTRQLRRGGYQKVNRWRPHFRLKYLLLVALADRGARRHRGRRSPRPALARHALVRLGDPARALVRRFERRPAPTDLRRRVADGRHLPRAARREPLDRALVVPGALPARRSARPRGARGDLPHPRRPGALQPLQPLRARLPGRRRAVRGAPRIGVPRLPQLRQRLSRGRDQLPGVRPDGRSGGRRRPAAAPADRRRARGRRGLPAAARDDGRGEPRGDPPAGRAAGGRLPRALRPLRRVRERLSHLGTPALAHDRRTRGPLHTRARGAARLVRAELHALRRGLPDRRHHRAHCPRRRAGSRAGRTASGATRVKIGTAFFDWGRCLPWAMATPCVVCEEVCPTSPKAITLEPADVVRGDGKTLRVGRPRIDPDRCVGCGLCEAKCPVAAPAAIRITRAGESRHPQTSFTLGRIS